jgi:hypothetical protein
MAVPVSLQDVVDQMDLISDNTVAYINRKSGELITLTTEDISLAEENGNSCSIPEWQREIVDKAKQALSNDDYLELPDRFEINEYSIMERYCYAIEDEQVRLAFLNAIKGKGAFRRFKDKLHEEGIDADWYKFRTKAFTQIAADFLLGQGISFVDHEGQGSTRVRSSFPCPK